jgi:hypothetical protein
MEISSLKEKKKKRDIIDGNARGVNYSLETWL